MALSLGSPPLGVTQHLALCSSDFPQTLRERLRSLSQLARLFYCKMTLISIGLVPVIDTFICQFVGTAVQLARNILQTPDPKMHQQAASLDK